MTIEELQELSKPSIDGAEGFESIGHKKGIQNGDLLDDIEVDMNSQWQPSNDGTMIKDPATCLLSHPSKSFSSKDNPKDKPTDKDKSSLGIGPSPRRSLQTRKKTKARRRGTTNVPLLLRATSLYMLKM